ncbi:hypothetical protein ACSX1A_08370 [Pontibacter sp. MBLB2868]|uniref:hypothetical protein n=1 Tax=Pontibacter sp. MBLB2868 TaxID=3451555 RepID=UPI003F752EF9
MVRQNDTLSGAYPSTSCLSHEVYRGDKLLAVYEPGTETLAIRWEGVVSSEEIREGYLAINVLIEKFAPKKWIIDLRKREKIRGADQSWVFKNVFSRALQVLRCDIFVAVLLPVYSYHELVDNMNGDELIQEDNLLILNHFLYEEEGRRWLENKDVLSA